MSSDRIIAITFVALVIVVLILAAVFSQGSVSDALT